MKKGKKMKTCPVCGASAFDDASVCYGCLYRYESQSGVSADVSSEVLSSASSVLPVSLTPLMQQESLATVRDPPEFCIRLTPRQYEGGSWKWDCSVEIAEKVQHEVIGRHALRVH